MSWETKSPQYHCNQICLNYFLTLQRHLDWPGTIITEGFYHNDRGNAAGTRDLFSTPSKGHTQWEESGWAVSNEAFLVGLSTFSRHDKALTYLKDDWRCDWFLSFIFALSATGESFSPSSSPLRWWAPGCDTASQPLRLWQHHCCVHLP